jgi:uncharacterized protein
MSQFDTQFHSQQWITRLFLRLRQRGYSLGVDEYRAALEAVECGYGDSEEALLELVQILWCHSRSQQMQVIPIWQTLQRDMEKEQLFRREVEVVTDADLGEQREEEYHTPLTETELVTEVRERSPLPDVSVLPIQAPFVPMERADILSLQNYFPVSRRSMVYGWRFLLRPVADGCRTVVDLGATIRRVTEQGYYLAPVYRRQQRNAARLLLLIDQNGSMMPFHRFARDLVETAKEESPLQDVLVFYFQNVPADHVYQDVYLTSPVLMQDVLEQCDQDTSVLVVSDGGAARGYRRQERIQNTTRFLLKLGKRTTYIAWLNPMSRSRWVGSSAEILAYLVPMFQVDRSGFDGAIDALRGLVKGGEEEG